MAKKKTTSTKTSKKTATIKKATTKKAAVTRKKALSPVANTTRKLHIFNVVFQLALVAAVVLLVKPLVYALSLGFMTKDALLSQTQTVFVPAEKVFLEFDLRWLLYALIASSMVYSVLALTRWRASYEKAQTGGVYLWRWVFLAIMGAIMVSFAAALSGIEDLATIKMGGALMAVAMAFAWLSERQNEKTRKPVKSAYVFSVVSGLFAMYAVIGSMVGTTLLGMVRFPWFVYAVTALTLLWFMSVITNLDVVNKRMGQSYDYAYAERNYVIITMVFQAAFVGVVLLGLAA